MAKFGFGKPTGIDLIGESAGVLPSQEWKRGRFNQAWYPGETVIAGIGQGYWVVTPLQLAQAVAIVAAEGVRASVRICCAPCKTGIDSKRELIEPPPAKPNIIKQSGELGLRSRRAWSRWSTAAPRTASTRVFRTRSPARPARPSASRARRGMDEHHPTARSSVTTCCSKHSRRPTTRASRSPSRSKPGRSGAHDAAPIARKILDAWLPGDRGARGRARQRRERRGRGGRGIALMLEDLIAQLRYRLIAVMPQAALRRAAALRRCLR